MGPIWGPLGYNWDAIGSWLGPMASYYGANGVHRWDTMGLWMGPFGPKEGPKVPCLGAMGIRWYPMGPRWHKLEDVKKQIFKPQNFLIFNININILTILISILILILGFENFWYWFWYWGWENFDIDIDFDIEEIVWRILILILILKTKFLKILILILNKNLILCHVCRTQGTTQDIFELLLTFWEFNLMQLK